MLAEVFYNHISADNVVLGKHGVIKHKLTAADRVGHSYLKRLRIFIRATCGESVKLASALEYAVGAIHEIGNSRTVSRAESQRIRSEIARAVEGAFLHKYIGGFLLTVLRDVGRKGVHLESFLGKCRRFYSFAVIRVAEIPVAVYRKGVSSIFRIYNKLLSILYKSDRHFYLRQALKIAAAKCQRLYRGDRSPFRYRTSAAAFANRILVFLFRK